MFSAWFEKRNEAKGILEVFECCKIMYDHRDSSSPGEFVLYQGGINPGKQPRFPNLAPSALPLNL